jgi:PAS domain S-box-containing protein
MGDGVPAFADPGQGAWLVLGIAVAVGLIALSVANWAVRKRAGNALHRLEQECKQAEQNRKNAEERFVKAFRQGPLGVSITSATTHRYIEVNDTFESLSGYRREELIGKSAIDVGIWADPSEREALVKRLVAEGHLRDVEFNFRRKDGEVRIAQASAELIDMDGEACVLGVVIDVTDRKHAEQSLQESERRFRLMADSAPVLMWLSGPDMLRTDFNQEWLRFAGRTMREDLGEGWTKSVHPADLRTCLDEYARAFHARQPFDIEYRLRRHDGQYRWMMDRGVPRFLDDGSFAGYIGCCIDVSNDKEAKAARAELGGRLIRAQEEERARVARELHDDINQRLALLANGLEELEKTAVENPESAPPQPFHRLWELTTEIATDIQQLSHQLHPSKLQYLGLGAAARELCQEFARQQKIEIQCAVHDLPQDLEESVALSLFRTMQESLRNVAKHSKAHHASIELTRVGSQVQLRVTDDGVGFRSDSPTHHGLGLVSMQERVRLIGGECSIRSFPGQGTVVDVIVPAVTRPERVA